MASTWIGKERSFNRSIGHMLSPMIRFAQRQTSLFSYIPSAAADVCHSRSWPQLNARMEQIALRQSEERVAGVQPGVALGTDSVSSPSAINRADRCSPRHGSPVSVEDVRILVIGLSGLHFESFGTLFVLRMQGETAMSTAHDSIGRVTERSTTCVKSYRTNAKVSVTAPLLHRNCSISGSFVPHGPRAR